MAETLPSWDAIVLAGGRGSRLGGIDKTALTFEGMSLLDHALAAVAGARRIVVVGPHELRERVPASVTVVAESPRFGGPAAAVAAGVAALAVDAAPRVAVLAADLPFAVEALGELVGVGRLASRVDGIVATDSNGRTQPLLAIYASTALARAVAIPDPLAGMSMRALTSGMVICRVQLPDRLCADIDTSVAAGLHGIRWEPEYSNA